MIDALCGIIIGIILIGLIVIMISLCITAGRYDDISDKDWQEYCRHQAELEDRKKRDGSRTSK